jgi:hypothetical protein
VWLLPAVVLSNCCCWLIRASAAATLASCSSSASSPAAGGDGDRGAGGGGGGAAVPRKGRLLGLCAAAAVSSAEPSNAQCWSLERFAGRDTVSAQHSRQVAGTVSRQQVDHSCAATGKDPGGHADLGAWELLCSSAFQHTSLAVGVGLEPQTTIGPRSPQQRRAEGSCSDGDQRPISTSYP